MDLLWSDRGEDQARNSLRQTLSALKKVIEIIDPLPLQVDRTTVSVLADSIEMDIFELENSKGCTDVSNLYRGEFLEGIVIRDPSGEEWLASERDRYRRMAVEALENLLIRQREAGETDSAVETGERLVYLDPLRESTWRLLMQIYAVRGERNHALKAYTRCTDILEKELCIEPEQETTELQMAIRDGSFDTASQDARPESMHSTHPSPTVTAELPVSALSQDPTQLSPEIFKVLTGEYLKLPDKPSIAVLPFQNMSGDPEQEYFADGLSEDIITALSRVPDLVVISRNSTFVYKGRAVDVRMVGRELAVGHVLEGSVRKSGERLRITAQLVSTGSGDHIWAEHYDRKLDDIFAIQDEITHDIVVELQGKLISGDYSRIAASGTHNIEAWELVIRAIPLVESLSREDHMLAKKLLGRALELDKNYPTAWALLGWIYWHESVWKWCSEPEKSMQMAYEAAQNSISVGAHFPGGYSLLGNIYMVRGDTNQAIAMNEKAVELAPSDSFTFAALANVLVDSGRLKEGIQKMQKAIRLCPFPFPWYLMVLGIGFHLSGENEAAISALEQVAERMPDSIFPLLWLASTLVEIGKLDEARAFYRVAHDMEPSFDVVSWANSFKSESHTRLKENLLVAGFPG
jgi:TolB-like protein/Tfp pilus assembly protein PilF